ncbi:SDR family oxidoreductase [soil metagenome]
MNVAVITGASMGLGEEFARQMAARKLNLVLVARSEDKLRTLAEELQKRHGIQAIPFACDLSKPGASGLVHEFLTKNGLHPTWLVNNAGFGLVGEFDSMDAGRITDMMMLNMVALVDLTRLLAPALRLGNDSRIINVASTAAFQPVPFFNVYAATKVFVLNFSDALHEELRGSPVKVLALCPGPTPTNFAQNGGLDPAIFEKGQSAKDVVRMGLQASDRNRAVLVCQRVLFTILLRFIPRFVVRFAAGKMARSFMRNGAVKR